MKTFLVTGGAGFIGANFILYLLKKYAGNINIINIDALTYASNTENLKQLTANKNYTFYKADIRNKLEIEGIFNRHNVDYVVNFAAESHVDRSIVEPEVFVSTNVVGTQVLLQTAKAFWETTTGFEEGKRFIQVSTDEVYGSLGDDGFFSEQSSIDPKSPYSASKAGADLLVKAFQATYGMPTLITRCSNNYGPYQYPEKLIPVTIYKCLTGQSIPVYGTGRNVRDWLYVEDHCRAIDEVIQRGVVGEVYNIGGNNELHNIDLIEKIISILLAIMPESDERKQRISKELISYVEDRKGHDYRYAIDSKKLQYTLGWQPNTSLETGLVKTVKWYLENENWLHQALNRQVYL